jgi:hypothetical protein
MAMPDQLQSALLRFQEGLTELERVRLAQLLRTDFTGSLLIGGADKETQTVNGVSRELSSEERQAVNIGLRQKLMAFQSGLAENDLIELLAQMSTSNGMRQSSFGVEE